MAHYNQHAAYNGQYPQQYQYQQQQQQGQTQYHPQAQALEHASYSQTPQQMASHQYTQPAQYQYPQAQPGHQYSQQYAQQYPQSYPQQQTQQHAQSYPHPYSQQQPQQGGYGQAYHYGQGQAQYNGHQIQYQAASPASYSGQGYSQTCHRCGQAGHFGHNCPQIQSGSPASDPQRDNRFPPHLQHQDTSSPLKTNLSRSSSLTQQSPYYSHGASVQSPSLSMSQTPQTATSTQWQGSPQPHNPQHQHQQANWQNYQVGSGVAHPQQISQGYPQSSMSPGTPPHGSHSKIPPSWNSEGLLPQPPHSHGTEGSFVQQPDESNPNPLTDNMVPNNEPYNPNPDSEDLEDDLSKLDVPDLPSLFLHFGDGPAKLVSQVLPSNFVVADALYPLAVPAPDSGGYCQSRFFQYKSEQDSLEDFRTSSLWKDRHEDTIFSAVEEHGIIMKLEDCLNVVKDRRRTRSEESSRKTSQQLQKLPAKSVEAAEMAEALARVEKALADAKAKEAELLANRRKAKAQQGQANGKSGGNKPDSFSPTAGRPAQLVDTHRRPSDNGRNGRNHAQDSRRFPHRPDDWSPNKDRGPLNRRFSGSPPHSNGSHKSDERRSYDGNKYAHINNVTPRAGQQPIDMISPPIVEDVDRGSRRGNASERQDFHTFGTEQIQSSETNHSRKRNFESRAESSSDEDDSSPRRQENDVTPKHKKRQPKVAAAYSRRW